MRSNKSIGELIRYYRLINQYSQGNLAEKVNVTESAISAWERGISKPGVDVARMISNEMSITLEDFFFYPEKNRQDKNTYELHETIKFDRSYINLKNIEYNAKTTYLHLDFSIHGYTVDENYIESILDLQLVFEDGRGVSADKKSIIDNAKHRPRFSPEFENLPLNVNDLVVRYSFKCDTLSSCTIELHQNGIIGKIYIDKDILDILNKKLKFKLYLNDEDTGPDDFDVLLKTMMFLSKNRRYKLMKDLLS